jgi:hypothetical protein
LRSTAEEEVMGAVVAAASTEAVVASAAAASMVAATAAAITAGMAADTGDITGGMVDPVADTAGDTAAARDMVGAADMAAWARAERRHPIRGHLKAVPEAIVLPRPAGTHSQDPEIAPEWVAELTRESGPEITREQAQAAWPAIALISQDAVEAQRIMPPLQTAAGIRLEATSAPALEPDQD